MRWLTRIRMALSDVVRRERFEREMDEELNAFLAMDAEERKRNGVSEAEARRAALLNLGGVEPAKERLRDLRTTASLESVVQDLRFGARLLRRHPGFAAAAILTIALGVGPLTAILSLANGLFVRPAPGVRDSGDLVQVEFVSRSPRGGIGRASVSYLNYAELTAGTRAFSGLAGQAPASISVAAQGTEARRVPGSFVMHDYFDVLGVRMAAGRTFAPDEDREPGGATVAILSQRLSRTLFAEAASTPGRTLQINGLRFTVIGVAPPGFHGTEPGSRTDVWLTGATSLYVQHSPRDRWDRGRANGVFNVFVGRLAPGITLEQAKAEVTTTTRALADTYPGDNGKFRTAEVWMARRPGLPIVARQRAGTFVALLGGVGALLFLIAAANVANLLLFRGVRRRNEIALRQALGATTWRLVRAHLFDALLLALLGGAAGVLLAFCSARLLEGAVLPGFGRLVLPIDWQVLGLALAVSIVMGLVFGGAPAVFASRRGDVATVLRRTSGTPRGRFLRNALTTVQLAVSLALLVGALLLLVTMRNLRGVDAGFDPSQVAGVAIDLSSHGYDDPRARAFYETLLERASVVPSVEALSVSQRAPFYGATNITHVHRSGDDPKKAISVASNGVTEGYFKALGIPIVRGRSFTNAEALALSDGTCGPVIVSQSLAARLFDTVAPLGQAVILPKNAMHGALECHIVGIAGDIRWNGPAEEPEPFLYRPLGRDAFGLSSDLIILARSSQPTAHVAAALRRAAASIDPAVPLFLDLSLTEALDLRMAEQRTISRVLALLALLGFLMAAVGLHGLVAETVVERTREFGIRMAVGASRPAIFAVVLRQAAVLAAIGMTAGLGLAAALSRMLRSQLFGVTALEPSIYIGAAALLATVVVLASLAPAIAATRVNPVEALRAE